MTPRGWAVVTGAAIAFASAVIYLATDHIATRGEDHTPED